MVMVMVLSWAVNDVTVVVVVVVVVLVVVVCGVRGTCNGYAHGSAIEHTAQR